MANQDVYWYEMNKERVKGLLNMLEESRLRGSMIPGLSLDTIIFTINGLIYENNSLHKKVEELNQKVDGLTK
jgi:hypothetical protein